MGAPCKTCERRIIGCHAECTEYLAYAEHRRKEQKALRDDKLVTSTLLTWYLDRREQVRYAAPKQKHCYH